MVRPTSLLLALAATACLSVSSLAATVEPLRGDLSVNRGSGFRAISGATQVNVGDVVMASPKGSGQVVYADGCRVEVRPGMVVSILRESPCRAANASAGFGSTVVPTPSYVPYALGVALTAGSVAAAIALSDNDNTHHRSVSP